MTTKPFGHDIHRSKQRTAHIYLRIKGLSVISSFAKHDLLMINSNKIWIKNKMLSLSNECIPGNSSAPTTKTEMTINDQQARPCPKTAKGNLFQRNLSSRSLFSGKVSAKITPSNHEYHLNTSKISIISGKIV